jgi:hypothetical protein
MTLLMSFFKSRKFKKSTTWLNVNFRLLIKVEISSKRNAQTTTYKFLPSIFRNRSSNRSTCGAISSTTTTTAALPPSATAEAEALAALALAALAATLQAKAEDAAAAWWLCVYGERGGGGGGALS